MDLLKCLPEPFREEAKGFDFSGARELRLRVGGPMRLKTAQGTLEGRALLSAADARLIADALTGHSLQSMAFQTGQGYAPLPGGHRLGLSGTFTGGRLLYVSSLCVRFAHEIKSAGMDVLPRIMESGRLKSALIIGAPGTGKTTLLRDLIRRLSENGLNVGAADERGELAALENGAPQLDVGPNTDVICGMQKADALMMLAMCMAPDALAADELGGREEVDAALACSALGVPLVLTAHAASAADVKRRGLDRLIAQGAVRRVVVLMEIGRARVYDAEEFMC